MLILIRNYICAFVTQELCLCFDNCPSLVCFDMTYLYGRLEPNSFSNRTWSLGACESIFSGSMTSTDISKSPMAPAEEDGKLPTEVCICLCFVHNCVYIQHSNIFFQGVYNLCGEQFLKAYRLLQFFSAPISNPSKVRPPPFAPHLPALCRSSWHFVNKKLAELGPFFDAWISFSCLTPLPITSIKSSECLHLGIIVTSREPITTGLAIHSWKIWMLLG